MSNWALIDCDDDGPVHVVPINDLIDHEDSADCWCVPKVEHVDNGTLITHNSADGREDFESGHGTTHRPKPRYRDS